MMIKHLLRRLDALDVCMQRYIARKRDRDLANVTDAELKAEILERLESEDPEWHAQYVAACEAEREIIFEDFVTFGRRENKIPARGGQR